MNISVVERAPEVRKRLVAMVRRVVCDASLAAGAEFWLDKSREFGLVPDILRDWGKGQPAALD